MVKLVEYKQTLCQHREPTSIILGTILVECNVYGFLQSKEENCPVGVASWT